jgi:hypothetical protein
MQNTSAPFALGPEPLLLFDGDLAYRDLNKNGRLDPYEDSRRPVDERVADLLSRMTVAEKAGMMFHTMIGMGQDGSLLAEIGPRNPQPTSSYFWAVTKASCARPVHLDAAFP